jgi:uncharacterized lipoprotein YajG
MKKISSLFVVVAGAFLLGACGMPEEAEELVETQESALENSASCVTLTAGDSTSCKSAADWKEYAAKVCASRGLQLSELSFANACKSTGTVNDSYSSIKFSCCP